jgi:succinate dehydrogenase / fumarate reductase cytochrome b subunit
MTYASIFKKAVMAITGLGWFGFVIGHLAGNLLIYQGPEDFNAYAAFLEGTGKLLYLAEAGLIVLLLGHVWMATKVTFENRKARQGAYAVNQTNGKASVASRTMAVAGIILLAFIITHVNMFKFGNRGGEDGLWGLVIRTFQDPLMVTWYVLAMLALGLHLSHGFGSALQTLGVVRPSLRAKFKTVGYVAGWAIALGFISFPVYAFIFLNP